MEDYAKIKDYEEKIKFFEEFHDWLENHDPYTQKIGFRNFYKKFEKLLIWIHDNNGWNEYQDADWYARRIYEGEKSYIDDDSMESDYRLCLSSSICLIIKKLKSHVNWLKSR